MYILSVQCAGMWTNVIAMVAMHSILWRLLRASTLERWCHCFSRMEQTSVSSLTLFGCSTWILCVHVQMYTISHCTCTKCISCEPFHLLSLSLSLSYTLPLQTRQIMRPTPLSMWPPNRDTRLSLWLWWKRAGRMST